MKKHIINFLHRGLIFGGFGPIIAGIVFFILSKTIDNFSLSGSQLLISIVSTYVLSFIHAGSSVFYQIDEWAIWKSLALHFSSLYLSYTSCYLINSWIPFIPIAIVIFTIVFILTYLIIWLAVCISLKVVSKRFNEKLK